MKAQLSKCIILDFKRYNKEEFLKEIEHELGKLPDDETISITGRLAVIARIGISKIEIRPKEIDAN